MKRVREPSNADTSPRETLWLMPSLFQKLMTLMVTALLLFATGVSTTPSFVRSMEETPARLLLEDHVAGHGSKINLFKSNRHLRARPIVDDPPRGRFLEAEQLGLPIWRDAAMGPLQNFLSERCTRAPPYRFV